jgi:hypothetical protein
MMRPVSKYETCILATGETWSAPGPRRKPSAAAAVKLVDWDRYQSGLSNMA